jgi:hypothetical protein
MISAGHLELLPIYCDMTDESRKSAATTRRPLLSNVPVPVTTYSSERVVTR